MDYEWSMNSTGSGEDVVNRSDILDIKVVGLIHKVDGRALLVPEDGVGDDCDKMHSLSA